MAQTSLQMPKQTRANSSNLTPNFSYFSPFVSIS